MPERALNRGNRLIGRSNRFFMSKRALTRRDELIGRSNTLAGCGRAAGMLPAPRRTLAGANKPH